MCSRSAEFSIGNANSCQLGSIQGSRDAVEACNGDALWYLNALFIEVVEKMVRLVIGGADKCGDTFINEHACLFGGLIGGHFILGADIYREAGVKGQAAAVECFNEGAETMQDPWGFDGVRPRVETDFLVSGLAERADEGVDGFTLVDIDAVDEIMVVVLYDRDAGNLVGDAVCECRTNGVDEDAAFPFCGADAPEQLGF